MTLALLLLSGITLLLLGGHYLVRHAVELAAKLNVPPLVIGLTIVAFGTSAPGLVISVGAVLTGLAKKLVTARPPAARSAPPAWRRRMRAGRD